MKPAPDQPVESGVMPKKLTPDSDEPIRLPEEFMDTVADLLNTQPPPDGWVEQEPGSEPEMEIDEESDPDS